MNENAAADLDRPGRQAGAAGRHQAPRRHGDADCRGAVGDHGGRQRLSRRSPAARSARSSTRSAARRRRWKSAAAHNDSGTAAFDTADIDIGLYDAAEVNLYIVNRANPTTLGLMFTGTIQPVSYDIAGQVSFDVRGPSVGAGTGYIQKFAPMCRTDLFSIVVRRQPGYLRAAPPRSRRSSTASTSRSRSRRRRPMAVSTAASS